MKVQNNPSFCGKIIIKTPEDIQGMEHLLTNRVKYRMRFAPKGTKLHFEDAGTTYPSKRYPQKLPLGKIGFATPASGNVFISGDVKVKSVLTEEYVLSIIKTGIERMKKGIKQGWAHDSI